MRSVVVILSVFLVFGVSADDVADSYVASRDADVVALVDAAQSLPIPTGDLCSDSRRAFSLARTLRYANSRNEAFGALARLASCTDPSVALEACASTLSLIASPRADSEDAMNTSLRADALAAFERLANDASRSEDVRVAARAAADHLALP